jgi:hypothetical protein
MPSHKPVLLTDKVGDVTAVGLRPDCFCYLHKHLFGYGVLPFLSVAPATSIGDFPSAVPCQFVHIWVDADDKTPMVHVAHLPFEDPALAAGCPAYLPPDPIEPCFKVHGVFNGLFSIRKAVAEADIAGMDEFVRHRPVDLVGVLLLPGRNWQWIDSPK